RAGTKAMVLAPHCGARLSDEQVIDAIKNAWSEFGHWQPVPSEMATISASPLIGAWRRWSVPTVATGVLLVIGAVWWLIGREQPRPAVVDRPPVVLSTKVIPRDTHVWESASIKPVALTKPQDQNRE